MVSPFMAFAKGAFEGYNQIQDEKRALAAEMALEERKNAIAGNAGSMFTSIGQDGSVVNHFTLSDEKEQGDRYVTNIQNAVQMFNSDFMNDLKERDPMRHNSIVGKVANYMSRYKKHESHDDGEISKTPKASILPDVLQTPFWGEVWSSISRKGKYDSTTSNSFTQIKNDEEGNVYMKQVVPNEGTEAWNNFAWAQAQRRQDNTVSSPQEAGQKYYSRYEKIAPLYTSGAITPDDQLFTDHSGRNITMGEIFEEIVAGGPADPALVDTIAYTVDVWNNSPQGRDKPITNYDLYKGFELASGESYDMSGSEDNYHQTISGQGKGNIYFTKVLGIDLKHLGSKVNSAQEAKTTVRNIYKVFRRNLELGQQVPSSEFANNVQQFYSALVEPGKISEQLSSIKDKALKSFGVRTDSSTVSYLEEAHSRIGKATGDAKEGAILEFYTNMLAYQLAVAIQGGTGGRTVSDQDVINMKNAFGKRLFSNGIVQLAVLDEIDLFLDDIIETNEYILQARDGTVAQAKAANALHKLKSGGLNLSTANKPYNTLNTEKFGGELERRIESKINTKDIIIKMPPTGWTSVGDRDKRIAEANFAIKLPNYNQLMDTGAPKVLSLTADNITSLGKKVWIVNEQGRFRDSGIKEFYYNTGEVDDYGNSIVELNSKFTEQDVENYLKKLRNLMMADERISTNPEYTTNNFKGIGE